ncbi:MAG: hypothetical protein AAGU74_02150 [Bacillota bacterium]
MKNTNYDKKKLRMIAGGLIIVLLCGIIWGTRSTIRSSLEYIDQVLDTYFANVTLEDDRQKNAELYQPERSRFEQLATKIANADSIQYNRRVDNMLPGDSYENVFEGKNGYTVDYCSVLTGNALYRKVTRAGKTRLVDLSTLLYNEIADTEDSIFNLKQNAPYILLAVAKTADDGTTEYTVKGKNLIARWYVDEQMQQISARFQYNGVDYTVRYWEITYDEPENNLFVLRTEAKVPVNFDAVIKALETQSITQTVLP